MIDLTQKDIYNDRVYLQKLKKAVASNDGKVIVDYIRFKLSEFDYKDIDATKTFNEIGQEFLAIKTAREKLEKILSFLDSRIN